LRVCGVAHAITIHRIGGIIEVTAAVTVGGTLLIFSVARRITVGGLRLVEGITRPITVRGVPCIGHITDDVTVGGCGYVVGVARAVAVGRTQLTRRTHTVTIYAVVFAGLTHVIASGVAGCSVYRATRLTGVSGAIAVGI
jgi:hypothetical protein